MELAERGKFVAPIPRIPLRFIRATLAPACIVINQLFREQFLQHGECFGQCLAIYGSELAD